MATQDLFPNVNSVVSNIIEQDVAREPSPVSPDAILVVGTATKGPLYQPVRINDNNISDLFGSAPNDIYAGSSLVKGYKEMISSMGTQTDIVAIRIGNATKATLDLYENREATSGDLSYTDDTIGLTIEALTEGEAGNNITATVYADENDLPTILDIRTPDGTVSFPMSVDGSVGTARVSELAASINAHATTSLYIQALPNVLENTEVIDIVSGAISGVIETRYDMASVSGSAGDKLIDITDAYTQSQYTDSSSIAAGVLTASLAKTPVKDSDESTETIDEFWRLVDDETLIGPALAGDVGTTSLTLAAASDTHWVAGEIEDLVVTKTDSNGTETILTLTTDYTFVAGTSIITLVTPVTLGETYEADYS